MPRAVCRAGRWPPGLQSRGGRSRNRSSFQKAVWKRDRMKGLYTLTQKLCFWESKLKKYFYSDRRVDLNFYPVLLQKGYEAAYRDGQVFKGTMPSKRGTLLSQSVSRTKRLGFGAPRFVFLNSSFIMLI